MAFITPWPAALWRCRGLKQAAQMNARSSITLPAAEVALIERLKRPETPAIARS